VRGDLGKKRTAGMARRLSVNDFARRLTGLGN
jgi:hypothetical protein